MTGDSEHARAVELPAPTAWPIVLAFGLTLFFAGLVTNLAVTVVGAVVAVAAGVGWGRLVLHPALGETHEPLVGAPRPVEAVPGTVQTLQPGMPGHRMRMPEKIHPYSAGAKGGLVGAAVMPIPALLYGLLSVHHSVWYPINLLAAMLLPRIEHLPPAEMVAYLEQFHGLEFVISIGIHLAISIGLGLVYGVLLPMLPEVPRPIAWGGLLMPILWTGVSYAALAVANPALPERVNWPWFIFSQFVFGLTMPAVVLWAHRWPAVLGGVVGGLVGGAVMAVPAVLWATATGHGLWYPINLVAGIVLPGPASVDVAELGDFHAAWFLAAAVIHAVLSVGFGVLFALVRPRLPALPGPVAWGGIVGPLLWTGAVYGFMGVLNPVMQEYVNWFWFAVSQFAYGVTVGLVVMRSEQVYVGQ